MIQGSHALYYGFSTMDWRAVGLDGTLIGMLWGLGVAAEIVLFALSGRLPKALRPTTLARDRRPGRDRPLDRDGVRSAYRAAAGAAASARGLVRRGSSRHDGISGARRAAGTGRDRAGLCRDLVGHRQRLGDIRLGLRLCRVGQPRVPRHGGDGAGRLDSALTAGRRWKQISARTLAEPIVRAALGIHRHQLGAAQEHHLG